ncbi:MAG: hypothetical protein GXO63_03385 [Candidatus Micrarchaeota archaeon]|nr:hypothetical protein [Candidatus Micrarchaeota archaeon]
MRKFLYLLAALLLVSMFFLLPGKNPSEMIIYPEEYVAYQDYLDFLGLPSGADYGVIEATVLSVSESDVCLDSECNEFYPKDTGTLRVDKIIAYTSFSGSENTPVEGFSAEENNTKSVPGSRGTGATVKHRKFPPLEEGQKVQAIFVLTARPSKVVYVTLTSTGNLESVLTSEKRSIPRENGTFVFTKLADSPGEKLFPGLKPGDRIRAKILYNGILYVDEYELI